MSQLTSLLNATKAEAKTAEIQGKILKVSSFAQTVSGQTHVDKDGNPDVLFSLFVQPIDDPEARVNVNFFGSRVEAEASRFDVSAIQVAEDGTLAEAYLIAICKKGRNEGSFLATSLETYTRAQWDAMDAETTQAIPEEDIPF